MSDERVVKDKNGVTISIGDVFTWSPNPTGPRFFVYLGFNDGAHHLVAFSQDVLNSTAPWKVLRNDYYNFEHCAIRVGTLPNLYECLANIFEETP